MTDRVRASFETMSIGLVVADRFRLVRQLGAGGMGVVWEAETRAGARVALKVLKRTRSATGHVVERFRREALVAGWLEHPHVVRTYETGEDDLGPFIVMELVAGPTLGALVRAEGALPSRRAARLARQLLDALTAVHEVGVIHRDVKPGNVLVAKDAAGADVAKLGDLGIALVASAPRLTELGQLVGTPGFMAPEQVTGDPPSVRSDVYAAGAVLYAALAGRPPFGGDSANEVLARVIAGERPRIDAIVPDLGTLAAVVETAMELDPARRFASARAMGEALASLDVNATREATLWTPRVSVAALGEWVRTGADPTRALQRGTGVMAIPNVPVLPPHVPGSATSPRVDVAPRRARYGAAAWVLVALVALAFGAGASLLFLAASDGAGETASGSVAGVASVAPATAPVPVLPPMAAASPLPDAGRVDAPASVEAPTADTAEDRPTTTTPRARAAARGETRAAPVTEPAAPEPPPSVGRYRLTRLTVLEADNHASTEVIAAHVRRRFVAFLACASAVTEPLRERPPWPVRLTATINSDGATLGRSVNAQDPMPDPVFACLSQAYDVPWPPPSSSRAYVGVDIVIDE